jgi:hypothetical protein
MATQFPDFFAALARPFEAHEVKIRAAAGGRQLHYITARTAMNRLDEVVGPEFWWDEYIPGNDSVMCRLTITMPDGRHVTKMDAGGYAGMADAGDDDKSGFSDAFKRAAAKFGVARYLYRDGVPNFAGDGTPPPEPAQRPQQAPQHANGHAADPGSKFGPPLQDAPRKAAPQQAGGSPYGNLPRSGRALFAWACEMGKKYEVDVVKYLNNWSKLQDFPARMVDFDDEQTRLAVEEAVRKLNVVNPEAKASDEEHLRLQRQNLVAAMRAILIQRGDDSHEAAHHLLNELSGHELVGGVVIHSVKDCHDAGLLGRYIAACDNLRQTEAHV